MYDYICDPNIMEDLLGTEMHLIVKKNIFTLINIMNISNGTLIERFKSFIKLLYESHIKSCAVNNNLLFLFYRNVYQNLKNVKFVYQSIKYLHMI